MLFDPSTFSDNIVLKSPNDKRLYRYLQLNNGLSVLLVHDPDIFPKGFENSEYLHTSSEEQSESEEEEDIEEELEEQNDNTKSDAPQIKKAAAAMCVGIGSFSDPLEAQGRAHFLEHMLFMGSEDFPDENEYDSFLSRHGGSSNAFTETEHTCYHFEVKREFLKGALRRFAQFFISPLVKSEAMDREVLAVDSEFNQVLQNDSCRLQQLQCYTSPEGHPFNKFFWGNKKSLVDAMDKGIDLRAHVVKLFSEFYYGGLMKLVVIGGESLDILHHWVLELFSGIKQGYGDKKIQSSEVLPIWKTGKLYRIEAVKDVHILELSWVLPCLHKEYLKKADEYLAHLIGHEGSGSLYFLLKLKGWATSVSAGVGNEGLKRSSLAYIFSISVHLTNTGLVNIFDIISLVYQYLKLLRRSSPQEWIFRELEDIGNMEFRFAEEQPQDDYAAELSANLLVYPPEHVIFGDYAHTIWDEGFIKNILGYFIPENMRVDLLSKSFEMSHGFNFEPWFRSKYVEEDIPPHFLSVWSDPLKIDESLSLPLRNEFIPRDFSIRAEGISIERPSGVVPTCILEDPFMKLWYKLDEIFKVPRANAYFRVTLRGSDDNPRNALLTELFIKLLQDDLNEVIYQASVAKLDVSSSIVNERMELKIFGFNHRLPILLSKILERAPRFLPCEDRFEVIKEDIERSLKNTNMKPLNHASYLRLQVLFHQFWDVEEKLVFLPDLSISMIKDFIPKLFSEIYIEGLCMGNILYEEVMNISVVFRNFFCQQSLPHGKKQVERVLCLPPGANFVRDVSVKNKSETNSVLELYFQIEYAHGEDEIRLKALIDLFDHIVEEPLFDQLRTKEQLGYVVDSGCRTTARVLGYCFRVQSSKFDPLYLQQRVDNFIDNVEELLNGIDEKSVEDHKRGLIDELLEKDPSLHYETNRVWEQIVDRRYMFDMARKEAEEVKDINKGDVIDWYRTYLRPHSPKCRRLAIRVWGCETDKRAPEAEKKCEVIDELATLKASSRFYPL